MKTIKLLSISFFISLVFTLTGCHSSIDSTYANHSFATQCLGHDGEFQTLRVWGKGKNQRSALEQAKKNALRDVIFKGITAGNGGCKTRPLLPMANAEEKNERYFNAFFGNDGDWKQFVSLNEKFGSRKVSKNSEIENWETTVLVNVAQLEDKLISDHLLNK